MILALAGGAGGLVLITDVRLESGLPSLSRALVLAGMVMVSLPSAEVAVIVACTMPLLSTLKLPAVPKRSVTTVTVVGAGAGAGAPPPPPGAGGGAIVTARGSCVV